MSAQTMFVVSPVYRTRIPIPSRASFNGFSSPSSLSGMRYNSSQTREVIPEQATVQHTMQIAPTTQPGGVDTMPSHIAKRIRVNCAACQANSVLSAAPKVKRNKAKPAAAVQARPSRRTRNTTNSVSSVKTRSTPPNTLSVTSATAVQTRSAPPTCLLANLATAVRTASVGSARFPVKTAAAPSQSTLARSTHLQAKLTTGVNTKSAGSTCLPAVPVTSGQTKSAQSTFKTNKSVAAVQITLAKPAFNTAKSASGQNILSRSTRLLDKNSNAGAQDRYLRPTRKTDTPVAAVQTGTAGSTCLPVTTAIVEQTTPPQPPTYISAKPATLAKNTFAQPTRHPARYVSSVQGKYFQSNSLPGGSAAVKTTSAWPLCILAKPVVPGKNTLAQSTSIQPKPTALEQNLPAAPNRIPARYVSSVQGRYFQSNRLPAKPAAATDKTTCMVYKGFMATLAVPDKNTTVQSTLNTNKPASVRLNNIAAKSIAADKATSTQSTSISTKPVATSGTNLARSTCIRAKPVTGDEKTSISYERAMARTAAPEQNTSARSTLNTGNSTRTQLTNTPAELATAADKKTSTRYDGFNFLQCGSHDSTLANNLDFTRRKKNYAEQQYIRMGGKKLVVKVKRSDPLSNGPVKSYCIRPGRDPNTMVYWLFC